MFETGMRIGELCVLKPEDITDKGIMIRATEVYYKDPKTHKTVFVIKENTKMDAGERLVVIRQSARAIIKQIRLLNPFGEYLFMKNNKRIHSTRFNYPLSKACKNLGILERSTHKIRKTYASKLIDANVPESIIKQQLGHSQIETTKKCYYRDMYDADYARRQIERAMMA